MYETNTKEQSLFQSEIQPVTEYVTTDFQKDIHTRMKASRVDKPLINKGVGSR